LTVQSYHYVVIDY